jgi:hypothetical protein
MIRKGCTDILIPFTVSWFSGVKSVKSLVLLAEKLPSLSGMIFILQISLIFLKFQRFFIDRSDLQKRSYLIRFTNYSSRFPGLSYNGQNQKNKGQEIYALPLGVALPAFLIFLSF